MIDPIYVAIGGTAFFIGLSFFITYVSGIFYDPSRANYDPEFIKINDENNKKIAEERQRIQAVWESQK